MWLRKGNLKRETKTFIIATQNIARRINYFKAIIDKTLQNSKCRLCDDKDEMINAANKQLWNRKFMFIQIVIGALGSVTEILLKEMEDVEIRGCVETIQATTFLRSPRILKRVLETLGDLLSLKIQ